MDVLAEQRKARDEQVFAALKKALKKEKARAAPKAKPKTKSEDTPKE
jgi:hypothetical protein